MKAFYQLGYRYFRMPWDGEARSELVDLVESGRIPAGRAIDLGCGTGSNAVFLAQHQFEVTGVDFASSAIDKARARADSSGVVVRFVVDDLTNLRHVAGTFDLLVDYGVLDDLRSRDRDRYVDNVVPLAQAGSRFLLWCFEWPEQRWERLFPFAMALRPGEAERRFGSAFTIERIAGEQFGRGLIRGYAAYLMTRR